ncbi:hypothetical protein PI125_g22851 [Phytophthora idaei]|nr:hypothetical protein PI125_g22851 [Phytophthora idaei]
MIKRKLDVDGNEVKGAKWRKLWTFTLVDGSSSGRTDREVLRERFAKVVDDVLCHHREPQGFSVNEACEESVVQDKQDEHILDDCLDYEQQVRPGSDGRDRRGAPEPRQRQLRHEPDGVNGRVGGFAEEHKEERNGAPTLYKGMTFATGKDVVSAVQNIALAQGKSMIVDRRSGMDRRLKCTSRSCTYTVQAYRKRQKNGTYGEWYIS